MTDDIVAFHVNHLVLVLWRPGALLHTHTHFLSPAMALSVLPRLATERTAMDRLRRYLSPGSTVVNLSDHDVLQIARRTIENGQLQAIVLGWFSPGPFAAELLKAILEWIKSRMSHNDITDRAKIFTNLLAKHRTFNADLLGYVLTVRSPANVKYLNEEQIDKAIKIMKRISGRERLGSEEASIVADFAKLRQENIPGTDKLMYDLFEGTEQRYVGSRFQLDFVVKHLKDIKEIERHRKNGLRGPDVVMKNGDFIDTKAKDWNWEYNNRKVKGESITQNSQGKSVNNMAEGKSISKNQETFLEKIIVQTEKYKEDFDELIGHTLFYVFKRDFTSAIPRHGRVFEDSRMFTRQEFDEIERKIQKYAEINRFDFKVKFTVE
jgi:hypothetical protein